MADSWLVENPHGESEEGLIGEDKYIQQAYAEGSKDQLKRVVEFLISHRVSHVAAFPEELIHTIRISIDYEDWQSLLQEVNDVAA